MGGIARVDTAEAAARRGHAELQTLILVAEHRGVGAQAAVEPVALEAGFVAPVGLRVADDASQVVQRRGVAAEVVPPFEALGCRQTSA